MKCNCRERRTCLALLLGTAACVPARPPRELELRFGVERDYGPFVFRDTDGAVKGLSVDILRALLPAAHLRLRWSEPHALSELLQLAEAGQIELLSSLRPTPERDSYLYFTAPYVVVPAVVALRSGQGDGQLWRLTGRRVAVGRGYAIEAFVRRYYPRIEWQAYSDDGLSLQALMSGQVEALVADLASVEHARRRLRLQPGALQLVADLGYSYPLSFGYAKGRADIGERLEQALDALPHTQLRAILARWLPEGGLDQVAVQPEREQLRGVGLASLAAAGAGALWTWHLRRGAA
ncbi:MAG: transporter substrate-binding domain-containing protein [Inhella sp.]